MSTFTIRQPSRRGLVYANGLLYESTGLNGKSSLRSVDLKTGAVQQRSDLPEQYFGEGLTDWQNTLIQITWRSHLGFVYDRFSFCLLRTFRFDGEGWGLTQDGHDLILSDGSSRLRFLDPTSFREIRSLRITDHGKPVDNLNELEYIHGQIYANIWHSDRIERISPKTGQVLGFLDLVGLLPAGQRTDPEAVLNGIAYDPADGHLFVTGKLWPKLFEIKLVAR
jgi:glutamine cyclotransferase